MLDDLKPEVQEEVRKFLRIKDKSNDDNYDTFPLFVLDEPETDDEEEKVLCGNCSREVDPETGIISEGKNRCERCKDI